MSGYFVDTLKELGMRPVRFHDLRHCAASLALLAGSDMKVVSEQLGHSGIAITLNRYTHVAAESRQRMAANMQALVRMGETIVRLVYTTSGMTLPLLLLCARF